MTALYQFTFAAEEPDSAGDMVADLVDAYVSPSALARALGVSRPAVYDWRHGAIPNPDTYDRIAELHSHLTAWEPAA